MEVYTGDISSHQPRPMLKETRKRHSYTANSTDGPGNASNKRRIVPEQSRKRTSISCDLCKTRRVKCVRTEPSSPMEGPSPCQNCIKLQVACQSALPRKKRIYGSVESLGTRFNVLELLIKDLLPNEDTSNTDRLLEIARSRNLPMPGNTDHAEPQVLSFLDNADAISYGAENSRSGALRPPVSSPPVFSNSAGATAPSQGPCSHSQRSSNADPLQSPPATHIRRDDKEGDENPFSEKQQISTHRSSLAMREKLYPNTQGMVSYLGPSSSFKFMIRVREILTGRSVGSLETRSTKSQTTNGSTTHEETLRHEFATNRASKVIERHIPNGIGDEADNAGSELNPLSSMRTARTFGTALLSGHHSTIEPVASGSRPGHEQTAGSSIAGRRDRPHPDAEDQDDTIASLVNRARKDLPSRQTLDALVEAFFKQVHPNYVVFHRGVFQNHYETLFPAPGDEEDEKSQHTDEMPSTLDVGWISSICMVLTFGAQALEYRDRRRALILQKRYFRVIEMALCQVLNTTTLSSIQALLLLQLYQHNAGERNASWVVLGCACRMAMAIGMHRDSISGGFDPVERELRRRIWWTLFGFEQDLCLTLGRPSAIADLEEVNVGLPNEALMDGISSVPPSHLKHSLQLTKMSHEIRKNLIAVACLAGTTKLREQANDVDRMTQQGNTMQVTKRLLERLDDWCHNLPQELGLQRYVAGTNYYRAVHLLHLNYNHYKQVLTRSYLLQEIESRLENAGGPRDTPRIIETADEKAMSNICLESALQTVLILENLRQANQLDGVTWQDYYYAYHSGILLLISILPGQVQSHRQNCNDMDGVPQRTKEALDKLVIIMQQPRLCKTMRFFASVTLQLAKIVGLVWHEDTAGPSTNVEPSRALPDSGLSAANLNNFTASTSVADDWLESFLSQSDPFSYEPGGFIPSAQHVQFGTSGITDGITSKSGEGDMVLMDGAGNPFSPFPSSLLSPPYFSNLGVDSTGFHSLSADDRPTDISTPKSMWDRIVLN